MAGSLAEEGEEGEDGVDGGIGGLRQEFQEGLDTTARAKVAQEAPEDGQQSLCVTQTCRHKQHSNVSPCNSDLRLQTQQSVHEWMDTINCENETQCKMDIIHLSFIFIFKLVKIVGFPVH